jgi:hypothetical protein
MIKILEKKSILTEINDKNSYMFYCEDIITQKFTNEEIAILATMDENELYESIQELHKERVKSTLTQPTMSKSRVIFFQLIDVWIKKKML